MAGTAITASRPDKAASTGDARPGHDLKNIPFAIIDSATIIVKRLDWSSPALHTVDMCP
jgi:hypothetical protein